VMFIDSGLCIIHGHRLNALCMWRFQMLTLTPADVVCCVWFIYPSLCWLCCPAIGTSCIDWAELNRLFTWGWRQSLVSETFFKIKNRAMDDIQKVNNDMYLFVFLSFMSVNWEEYGRKWRPIFIVLEGITKSKETMKVE
jgi:hypothetical protein